MFGRATGRDHILPARAVVCAVRSAVRKWSPARFLVLIRHAERPPFAAGMTSADMAATSITAQGVVDAVLLGEQLPVPVELVASPVLRTVQTAEALAEGMSRRTRRVPPRVDTWEQLAADHDGGTGSVILVEAQRALQDRVGYVLYVTHDSVVSLAADALVGHPSHVGTIYPVPFLGGLFVGFPS